MLNSVKEFFESVISSCNWRHYHYTINSKLNDARERYRFNNVWSYDGKILCKAKNEVKGCCD